MIQFLRKPSNQKIIVLAIACLVIPGFIFFGIAMDDSGTPSSAGKLEGKKIKTQEFVRNHDAMRRELELFHGIPASQISQLADMEVLTWQRILLVHAAEKEGIRISDEEVVQWIQSQKVFQVDGAFNSDFYNRVVQEYLRIEPTQFERSVREFMSLQKVRDKLRGDLTISEEERKEAFKTLFGARDFHYIVVPKEDLKNIEPVTDEEIKQMYDQLKDMLYSAPSVQVRYVRKPIDPADTRSVDELLTASGVQTGFFSQEDPIPTLGLSTELSEKIFGLQNPGDRTEWMTYNDGEYLFELVQSKPQTPMTFEDAQIVLKTRAEEQKTQEALFKYAQEIYKKAEESSWDAMVKEYGFTQYEAAGYTENVYLEKVGELPQVMASLRKVKVGELSFPVPTSNGFMMAQVTAIHDPSPEAFAKHSEQVENQLKLQHESEALNNAMKTYQDKLEINEKTMKALFPSKYQTEVN